MSKIDWRWHFRGNPKHVRWKHGPLAGTMACFALAALNSAPVGAQTTRHSGHHMEQGRKTVLRTPESIVAEHRELHEVLARAAGEVGELGSAARDLEKVLAPYFQREEEIATPPLGLLSALANGEATSEMRAVLPLTEALERELPQMLREHGAIRAATAKFRAAALSAKRAEYVRFSDELAGHAREEEEILYPAAILVGRYIARTTSPK